VARDRASRPEAKPLRLFVAVDMPQDVRERLAGVAKGLRERLPGGRWPPPHNWHLTMKFLGPTWPRLLEWVQEACADVAAAHSRFTSSVSGLGAFPNERRARVLWGGLEDPDGSLAAIASHLDRALSNEFKTEKRAFTPHLTIARFTPPVALGDALQGLEVRSEPFPIDRLVLYQSHLQRPAPRYEMVGEFLFSGPLPPSVP
jgi:2'-5' RNA ligase